MKGFDPKEQRIQREAIHLGCDYGDAAPKYLLEKRPGEPALEDLENFYLGCGGTMIANMYAVVYKAKGQNGADEWLAKVFMGIPAVVRTKVPVFLTIDAKSRPMDVDAGDKGKDKPGLFGKQWECTCELIETGLCLPCLERLKGTMKTFMLSIGGYMKTMGEMAKEVKKGCSACDMKNLDAVLASIIEENLLPAGPASGAEFGNQLAVFIEGMAHQMGVKELPLTEKAWANKDREAN